MTADSEKDILNFYHPNDRRILNEGLFLAYIHRAIAAQFEHTIVVTRNEPIILTL